MLLLNHLPKDVSAMTGGTEGVGYLAPSTGSNQVQQQMIFTILNTVHFDMTLENCLGFMILVILHVLTEFYDSVAHCENSKSMGVNLILMFSEKDRLTAVV